MSLIINPGLNNRFQTWTELFFDKTYFDAWYNLGIGAMSATGNTIILKGISYSPTGSSANINTPNYWSTDGGETWFKQSVDQYDNPSYVFSITRDGKKIIQSQIGVSRSVKQRDNYFTSTTLNTTAELGSHYISDDGNTIVGFGRVDINSSSGAILESNDGGYTFYQSKGPPNPGYSDPRWASLSVSGNAQIRTVSKRDQFRNEPQYPTNTPIVVKYDASLLSWFDVFYINNQSAGIAGIKMSQSGQIQAMVVSTFYVINKTGCGIYMSYDYGSNWEIKYPFDENWDGIYVSDDGGFLVATAAAKVFHSYDSGLNWILISSNLSGLAISGNGKKQMNFLFYGSSYYPNKVCSVKINNNYGLE